MLELVAGCRGKVQVMQEVGKCRQHGKSEVEAAAEIWGACEDANDYQGGRGKGVPADEVIT